MPQDPRKRQRKLERRKAKQKAERHESARRPDPRSLSARLERASAAPILHCAMSAEIREQGIGEVLVSRQLNNGDVAFGVFLLDVYCLGVKNVITDVAPRARYDRDLYGKLTRRYTLTPLKPECARKLVEGAVGYALDLRA